MEIQKPKEFFLKSPYKFFNGATRLEIPIRLYDIEKFVVIQHSFPGMEQEIAIFDTFIEAEQALNQWYQQSDIYTNYSIKRVILS